MKRSAIISDCGKYRYELKRRWIKQGPTALFIMLNPSTADGLKDDPTVRRCINFARREGCSALRIVNLMGYRATDPTELPVDVSEVLGPDNHAHIEHALEYTQGPIIAAWGAHPRGREPAELLTPLLNRRGKTVYCLGKTMSGAPRHPLYLSNQAPLQVLHE